MNKTALVLVVATATLAGCSGDDDGQSNPAAVIETYVSAYNADDIDAVMALFTEDSTMVGAIVGEAVGLDAIRQFTIEDREMAADADPYAISNVQTDGDTVTWDHTWTNDAGEDWCMQGLSAVITDGTIVSWAFAEPELCN
ncbi:MAG: nuclear transport factor 2 family protein [Jiangellales bacterium]